MNRIFDSFSHDNIQELSFFRAGDFRLPLGNKTYVMGILNVTPDSFSDGGRYFSLSEAVNQALAMVSQGANLIDVGGESTRPGYTPVTQEEELNRVLPVIKALKQEVNVPISIDTWKAPVAQAAVLAGASIVNDVWGCRKDPAIAQVAAQTGAGLIMMFNAYDSTLVQKSTNILADCVDYLTQSIAIAKKAGLADEQLMVDPGIGFGVTTQESLALIRGIPTLKKLGFPLLLGPSRKRFIGDILDKTVDDRLIGTVAACCTGAGLGADMVRVHDVLEVTQALQITDKILK